MILRILENGRGEAPVDAAAAVATAKLLHDTIKDGSSMMGGLKVRARPACLCSLIPLQHYRFQ
jgi:hypothetical protein